VPEYIGSGDFLRAASRATEPVANSPAQADRPFIAVFENSHGALSIPVYVGGVMAVLFAAVAWRRRREGGPVLAIAAIATALMIIVAVFAEIGFTGNLRYITLPAALVCVLAGIGWADLLDALRGRFGAVVAVAVGVVALAASAPFLVSDARRFGDEMDMMRNAATRADALPGAIERAGGQAAIKRCGRVSTMPLQTQIVAWQLHLQQVQVAAPPLPTGTRFHPRRAGWEVKQDC
jgi:asparagine N-glycosylation enzyme membrane subunit Stt3